MDRNRVLELALEALEKQRADVEAAIAEVEELQGGIPRRIVRRPELPTLVVVKRRSQTAAERKSQSERMKAYWARKRAESAKLSAAQAPETATKKRKPKTAAHRRAQSKAMKAYWAKRKKGNQ